MFYYLFKACFVICREPFINGEAVPYDPKYHEEWIRSNSRANERNRRNDRPRNYDRSRNFDRRRENMQNRDFQNRGQPPMPNQAGQNPGPNMPRPANNMRTLNNMGPRPPTWVQCLPTTTWVQTTVMCSSHRTAVVGSPTTIAVKVGLLNACPTTIAKF
ncbi:unnamed protein product [Prunus armeniaca]